MAVAPKINGDVRPVAVLDTTVYQNPLTASFNGTITGATTIVVSGLNGTITPGDIIRGAGIPEGTTVSAYAAPTITASVPVGESLIVNALQSVPLTTSSLLFTAAATVQSSGPKLDYYTITVQSNKHQTVLDLIQEKATVSSYQINNATTLAVSFYPANVWGEDNVAFGVAAPTVLANLRAQVPAPLTAATLIAAVLKGAAFTG
jgi:hypothetical protein